MPDWLDVSATAPRIAYVATSGQTTFDVPFEFLEEEHLAVYQNDERLTLTTDYTVSGEGDEDGGTITLETGATAGDSIVIALDVPLELTTHIPVTGRLDVPAINLQFTLLIMMIKQLDATRVRSLHQPASDTEDLDDLPAAADRALKYLGFDADGQPTVLSSVSTAVAATAFMASVLSTADDAAEARSLVGITDQSAYTGLSNWQFCR